MNMLREDIVQAEMASGRDPRAIAGDLHGGSRRAVTRRSMLAGTAALATGALAGCAGPGAAGDPEGSSATAGNASARAARVRIGTMATEDFLPAWVAEQEGLFPEDAEVELISFQSAQELSLALSAAEMDLAMTDPQVAASLTAGGTPMQLCWVALGATPEQGRFGIQVGPDSGIEAPQDLHGASIGVGSNTVPEYVMDRLLAQAGIGAGDFTKEEIKKMPVRFQMMTSGQTDAAALPASLLALGEAQGCRTVIDDTHGENLSQSVIAARVAFAEGEGGAAAIAAVRSGWNEGAAAINKDPERFRSLLVERANLAEPLKERYAIATYPIDVAPTSDMVQPQLDWMLDKGYLDRALTYREEAGTFEA